MKGRHEVAMVSDCHSYPLRPDDLTCNWCGKANGTHPRSDDVLLRRIDGELCDWDSPRHLATSDLWTTIHKVAVLILAERKAMVEVPRTYCWSYRVVVEDDRTNDGTPIDHYDPDNPCPGPHGIMWAAK